MEEQCFSIMILPYIKKLIKNDIDLFERDLHEDCISTRLAYYMANGIEDSLNEIKVDCQYNRNGRETKELDGHNRIPDIIVHERASNRNNIVMIEAKKNQLAQSDTDKINLFLELPYKYMMCIGLLYLPRSSVLNVCMLSKSKHINYRISKHDCSIVKTYDLNRNDTDEYMENLFLANDV